MEASRRRLSAFLPFSALLPALIIGVLTMRVLGVATIAWPVNLAAAAIGLLVFAMLVYARWKPSQWALHWMAFGSITAIVATFVMDGSDGVHRWISVGGLRLHASAIVAPVLIACVATVSSRRVAIGVAVATALLLAVQPDAAQAISFAVACAIVLSRDPRFGPGERIVGLVALTACAIGSLLRPDPLQPVRHVEGIVEAVNARGAAWAVAAMVALLLLPMPFFVAWLRHRQTLTLGLGVYVTSITIAPAWGTFPVPIMGYGVSPILGYSVALALCVRSSVCTPAGAAVAATNETLGGSDLRPA